MYTIKTCNHCQTQFEASNKEINRGNAKYCSKTCSWAAKRGQIKTTPNVSCAICNKKFYRSPNNQKKSKSGFLFCSRICKDTAQKVNRPYSIPAIQPTNYGKGNTHSETYRTLCFEHHSKSCSRCGYNKYPEIIVVHHKDRNHSNNDISNLEPLCPTCHEEEHFLSKDGRWWKSGGARGN